MSAATPLPKQGDVFFDSRGADRALRLSRHPDAGVVVLSIWNGGVCQGTFRLPSDQIATLAEALLSAAPEPRPPLPQTGQYEPPPAEPYEAPPAERYEAPAAERYEPRPAGRYDPAAGGGERPPASYESSPPGRYESPPAAPYDRSEPRPAGDGPPPHERFESQPPGDFEPRPAWRPDPPTVP
ncbi:hypothetical protein [Actinoallomurus liliacearum]|uniref:hypothetical protein n=1 Tax=Actinoallomurus liliacearum TaxID=1080073 RepID=UPI0031E56676